MGRVQSESAMPDTSVASYDASIVLPGADAGPAPAQEDAASDVSVDASLSDVLEVDSGVMDASLPDASLPDASLPDASLPDASLPDASLPDASLPDAGACADLCNVDPVDTCIRNVHRNYRPSNRCMNGECVLEETSENCIYGCAGQVCASRQTLTVSRLTPTVCSIAQDRSLSCWGENGQGQVGLSSASPTDYVISPRRVDTNVDAVWGLGAMTCARSAEAVRCWGQARPAANVILQGRLRPTAIPALRPVVDVAVSLTTTIHFLHLDGTVSSLPWEPYRGDPGRYPGPGTPTAADLSGFIDIESSNATICGIRSDRSVQCRGGIDSPLAVRANHLSVGQTSACVVLADATVACWGYANSYGQLGPTSDGTVDLPHAIPLLSNVLTTVAGDTHHCALRQSGTVACWGSNVFGELAQTADGGGSLPRPHPRPSDVAGLENVVEIAAGAHITCAKTAAREVYCWGERYGHRPLRVL